MTISIAPARAEYTANAGQAVFNFPFKIFSISDLNVYITPAGQDSNDSTNITTAYAVSGVGDEDGGTITLTVGTNLNDLVTIVSNVPSSRTTDYQNNGDFTPDVVNADLDRVVSIAKKVEDSAGRTLEFQQSQQGASNLTLPRPIAGLALRWNGGETGLENFEPSTVSNEAIGSDKVVINYSVLLVAVNDTSLKLNQACNIAERATGDGGGAMWDVVLASTVAPNTVNAVQCVGVPSLALVLRPKESVKTSQLGPDAFSVASAYPVVIVDVDTTKTGTYSIPASQQIIFRSSTVFQNDDLAAFETPNPFWAITGNGKIQRIGAPPTVEIVGSIGISVLQGSVEHNITGNIEVSNFAQAGAVFNGGGVIAGGVSYASTVGLRCFDNWNGIEFLDGFSSEYHSLSNVWCKFNHNDGVLLESGNITWNGGGAVSNGNAGFHLRHPAAGGNPQHGTVTGALINHNVEHAIHADHVNTGHVFTGCAYFDNADKSKGRITLENSRAISINGGILAVAIEYIDDGSHVHRGYNRISGMDVRDAVTVIDPTKRIFRDGNYTALSTWDLNDRERFNATKRTNSDTVITGASSYNLTTEFGFTVVDNRDAIHPTFGTLIQPWDADVVTDIDAVIYLSTAATAATLLVLMIDVNQTGSYVGVKTFQAQTMADPTGLILHLKASHTFDAPKDAQIAWFFQHGSTTNNTIKGLGLMRFIADY